MKQTILVTGASGQLGRELLRSAGQDIQCIATTRQELDIGDQPAVGRLLAEIKPQWVINAAAYTAVDKAESEPELARRVNAFGAGYLAAACREP